MIIRVNDNAVEYSLDLAHVDVLVLHLLGNEVAGPDSESVVVDGDELVVVLVEEINLVGNIHANGVSANSLSSGDLPDDERVVVLPTKRCQVLFVV